MDTNQGRPIYISGATAQQIYTGKCVLVRIIVGADVLSGDIQVDEGTAAVSANTKLKLTSSTLKGVYECGIEFANGIYSTHTNQTKVTYVVRPIN